MSSLRSLAFILCSARRLSRAVFLCSPLRSRTPTNAQNMATNTATNMDPNMATNRAASMSVSSRRVYNPTNSLHRHWCLETTLVCKVTISIVFLDYSSRRRGLPMGSKQCRLGIRFSGAGRRQLAETIAGGVTRKRRIQGSYLGGQTRTCPPCRASSIMLGAILSMGVEPWNPTLRKPRGVGRPRSMQRREKPG
jgi:hypothetical protein